ncbi:MAG: DUF421 domain-containing protein [Oxalicibacterium faecigallinarum]|uniref:DUF421 domain-containing protein n=1 Tax=Oxalicibacterium faecigallinarum TaxID=573741 RepID=UPI00280969E1|nr:YetF domain-containing protein [Oxalicibacterium faecigallinarum]MDQ7970118.1 DUF421 domain-containing protein [Oxalicibacterium faecigallinarum]
MLDMSVSWMELMARGAIVYFVLLVMIRISGKRTVGQFTPFDLLVIMLLSEAVSNSMSGGDESLLGGLILAATLIVLNFTIGLVTSRSHKIADLVDGTAELVGRDGVIFKDRLARARVGMADLEQALREADCDLSEMKCAFLEADGSISILKK